MRPRCGPSSGAPHQQLVVYQAEPTTPTAPAFERLRVRADNALSKALQDAGQALTTRTD
ncbi:hypothetical protein [Nonomuraea sp. NPDC049709]|uniref:hypothetical protein n=1 Tax=Nonomuraea sp. NPDC049709 TaxID=3154736 RepID=UPI00341C3A4B